MAWGTSWLTSWGNSWGAGVTPDDDVVLLGGGPGYDPHNWRLRQDYLLEIQAKEAQAEADRLQEEYQTLQARKEAAEDAKAKKKLVTLAKEEAWLQQQLLAQLAYIEELQNLIVFNRNRATALLLLAAACPFTRLV